MIIADDFYGLKNAENLISTIVLLAGKNDITVILTSQYYTDFKPKLRKLAHKFGFCLYLKEIDLLLVDYSYREHNERNPFDFIFQDSNNIFYYENAVKTASKLYDTKFPVKVATDNNMIEEVVKISNNIDELDVNLQNCFKNSSKRNRIFNKIIKENLKFS